MLGQQDAAEHLLLRHHVANESAAVTARADRTGALLVDGAGIVGELGVAEVKAPWLENAVPMRPVRVGSTQSNMSTPMPTARTSVVGLPTPMR